MTTVSQAIVQAEPGEYWVHDGGTSKRVDIRGTKDGFRSVLFKDQQIDFNGEDGRVIGHTTGMDIMTFCRPGVTVGAA